MVQFLFFLCSFSELADWSTACRAANVFAGSMLSVVGTPSKMNITSKVYLGPFGRW